MTPDPVTRGLAPKPLPAVRAERRVEIERQHRARILDATLSIATVAGYAELSIASILALAQVQRRTFNGMFGGKEDAFLAAYRKQVGDLDAALRDAWNGRDDPSHRVTACLDAAVAFLRADPVRAEFVLLEVHAAGINAVGLQRAVVETLVDRTTVILAEAGIDDPAHARRHAEFAVGAVHDALRSSVFRGELDRLPARVPDLARTAFPMLTPEVQVDQPAHHGDSGVVIAVKPQKLK